MPALAQDAAVGNPALPRDLTPWGMFTQHKSPMDAYAAQTGRDQKPTQRRTRVRPNPNL
jgi:hypothetical protein